VKRYLENPKQANIVYINAEELVFDCVIHGWQNYLPHPTH
jgi:hypothetical protein